MELIKKGAEAELFKSTFLGKPSLIKDRIPKDYRAKELDKKIRQERTTKEVGLLHKAKAFVKTPVIYSIEKQGKKIVMEFIDGKQLKEVLTKKTIGCCSEFGKQIALLHKNNLIHGDLTTSNILVSGKELVFIDFGLGFESDKFEDKAVDLLGLKRTYIATHSEIPEGWDNILKAYLKEYPESNIASKMEKIEKRARYH